MIHFIHKTFKLHGITSRFFFWVVLLVFLTSGLYLVTYSAVDKSKRIEEVEQDLQYVLMNQKNIIEVWTKNRFQEVRFFSNFLVTDEVDLNMLANRFSYYHDFYKHFNAIVYVDESGYVKIDTGTDEVILEDETVNIADRDYFQRAKEGEETLHVVVNKQPTGEQAVIFTAPVFSVNHQFKGLVFTAIHLGDINNLLIESIKGETGKTTFFNEEGQIITTLSKKTRPTDLYQGEVDHQLLERVTSNESNFINYENSEGDHIFATHTSLLNDDYYLMSEIDEKEVLEAHVSMVAIMVIITIAIYIAAIIVIFPVSRGLLRPFFYIVTGLNRMKEGQYNTQLDDQKFKASPVELRHMMQGFNEMARSIKENKSLQIFVRESPARKRAGMNRSLCTPFMI